MTWYFIFKICDVTYLNDMLFFVSTHPFNSKTLIKKIKIEKNYDKISIFKLFKYSCLLFIIHCSNATNNI